MTLFQITSLGYIMGMSAIAFGVLCGEGVSSKTLISQILTSPGQCAVYDLISNYVTWLYNGYVSHCVRGPVW